MSEKDMVALVDGQIEDSVERLNGMLKEFEELQKTIRTAQQKINLIQREVDRVQGEQRILGKQYKELTGKEYKAKPVDKEE